MQHVLNLTGVHSCWSDFDGNAACPKWLGFKSILIELIADFAKYYLLCWS